MSTTASEEVRMWAVEKAHAHLADAGHKREAADVIERAKAYEAYVRPHRGERPPPPNPGRSG